MWSQKKPLVPEEAAMPRIGLRQLKAHASEVLRDVQNNRTRYIVTNRGEPVGIVIPYAPGQDVEPVSREESWMRLVETLDQVRSAWTSPLTAEDIMNEERR
jgi:prevent-host-death family protein